MAKLSENVKAMRGHVNKIFGKKQAAKIGTYTESTGGGTPLKKGEKLKDHPEAKRVQQPRDEDGRFTYNSANAKPLKYGPSRGVTIPPFLRGAKMVFATKKNRGIVFDGTTWNFKIDMTAGQLVEKFKDILGAKSAADSIERKKGRKSNAEKEAMKKKQEGFVKPDTTIEKDLDYEIDYYIDDFRARIGETMQGFRRKYKKPRRKFAEKKESPKKETAQPAQPTQSADKNKLDANLAKTNREEFKKQHKETLNELSEKMKGFSEDDIVDIIAEEEITDKEELIRLYNIAIKGE